MRAAGLEIEVLQLRADNRLLTRRLAAERTRRAAAERAAREADDHAVAALRDVLATAEDERRRAAVLLQQAMQDALYLSQRNAQLERQLAQAVAYEPD